MRPTFLALALSLLPAVALGQYPSKEAPVGGAVPASVTPIGAAVAADGASPTARASATLAPPIVDTQGRAFVRLDHPRRFSCGVTGQAAALLECAAVVASNSYWITDIVAQSSTTTAGDFAIQSGTGTNCGTGTAAVFPSPPMTTAARFKAPANTSPPAVIAFTTPLKVTQGHALCAIGMATNTLNLQVSGYIAP